MCIHTALQSEMLKFISRQLVFSIYSTILEQRIMLASSRKNSSLLEKDIVISTIDQFDPESVEKCSVFECSCHHAVFKLCWLIVLPFSNSAVKHLPFSCDCAGTVWAQS